MAMMREMPAAAARERTASRSERRAEESRWAWESVSMPWLEGLGGVLVFWER